MEWWKKNKTLVLTVAIAVLLAVVVIVVVWGVTPIQPYTMSDVPTLQSRLQGNEFRDMAFVEQMPFQGDVQYYLAYADGSNGVVPIHFEQAFITPRGYLMVLRGQDRIMTVRYNLGTICYVRDKLPPAKWDNFYTLTIQGEQTEMYISPDKITNTAQLRAIGVDDIDSYTCLECANYPNYIVHFFYRGEYEMQQVAQDLEMVLNQLAV